MFCYQCEQTAKGQGCTKIGVCGKDSKVAALQDLLIYAVKGLALHGVQARKVGIIDEKIDDFTVKAMFSTLTNVNFDPDRFISLINRCVEYREKLKSKVKKAGGWTDYVDGPAIFRPESTINGLVSQGEKIGIKSDQNVDPNILSLRQILTLGVKGVAAYTDHASILGKRDPSIFEFIYKALAGTLNNKLSIDDLLGLVLECGKVNIKAMEILDSANTSAYGKPVPTKVPLGVKKGKAILVSGHDLKDLENILKQTEGKGIYVYTHGEMLPAHGYQGLKKYRHFYGHYGTGWQNQRKEFEKFPGSIIITTNCIQKPADSYKDNIFTTGLVGWPGVRHVEDKNFGKAIERALALNGFVKDKEGKTVTVGFAKDAVLSVADKIIKAVKNKNIRHFFLVAGCDGAKPGRNYYSEFVEKVPNNCVVLTLACGKFRFFDKDMGDIGGIPRLIDIGQCNDAYSAIQIASALSNAFNCKINDLPLSFILSWYEQKACAILLSLFYLGIKNIRLGPSLPAFISPDVLNLLVQKFNIMPIKTAEEDLKNILG